jgi:hypothetical protein
MVSIVQKQNSFIGGLLTEEAYGRSDKPTYYHSLRRANNIVIDGHGGFRRRPGTSLVGEIAHPLSPISVGYTVTAPNGGDVSKLTNGDYFDYFKTTAAIGTTNGYVSFQVTFGTITYVDYFDVYMVSLDDGDNGRPLGTSEFNIQSSSDGGETWETAKNIYMTNGDDDSYRGAIHNSITGIRLVRVGTEDLGTNVLWCGGIGIFVETGGHTAYRLAPLVHNATGNYLLVFSGNRLTIFRRGVAIYSLPTPQVVPSQLGHLKFSALGESLIITHVDIPPLMVQRFRSDDMWRIFPVVFSMVPRYESIIRKEPLNGSLSVTVSSDVYKVSGDSDTFYDSDIGCLVYGNGGSGRIIGYTDARNVTITVIHRFSSHGDVKVGGWTIDRASLPLWGPEYGYPECSGFFGNRLWLGGFKRTPRTVAGSVIGDYLNFDPGGGDDDDAILVSLASGASNHNVRYIFSSDNLEIFSDTGVFSLKKYDAGTQTALASAFYFRTPIGIEPYLSPFRLDDGGTLFVKRGRNDVRELSYDDGSYSYEVPSRAVWCSSAIRGVTSLCVSPGDGNGITNHVFIVNGSGNLACMTFLLSDNIHAATVWTTQGHFLSCESTLQDTYLVVERGGKVFLERIVQDAYLDSEVVYHDCDGGEVGGLSHIAGMVVQVRADGEYLGEYPVSPNGTVTIPIGHWNTVHVGLGYEVDVVPVPPENPNPPLAGRWINYSSALISCYDTQEILVDGYVPEFLGRTFGSSTPAPLAPKTGRYRVFLGNSPDLDPTLRISQPRPLDVNIRGIAYTIDVNGNNF